MAAGAARPAEPLLALPAAERLLVAELFVSLQGESTHAGRPCFFIRLTGCHLRCGWCDTAYAFHGGSWWRVADLVSEAARQGLPLVEVTGGEPLLQPGVFPLLARLADAGHEVLLETSGSLDISGVDLRVRRIVDLKCPGSGEVTANRWENLAHLRASDELKFVVADEADYLWAREVIREHGLGARCPVHLSPVHGALDLPSLAAWILRDRLPVRLTLQQHKLIWGAAAKGV